MRFMGRKESLDKLINFLQAAIFALFACLVSVIGFIATNYGNLALELLFVCVCIAALLVVSMIIAAILFIKKIKELEDL